MTKDEFEKVKAALQPGERVRVICSDPHYGDRFVGMEGIFERIANDTGAARGLVKLDGTVRWLHPDCIARVSEQQPNAYDRNFALLLSAFSFEAGNAYGSDNMDDVESSIEYAEESIAENGLSFEEYGEQLLECAVRILKMQAKQPRARLYTAAEVREITERAAEFASALSVVARHNALRFDVSELSAAEVIAEDPDLRVTDIGQVDKLIAARAVALAMPKEGE